MTDAEAFEEYEQKMDEINDALLESYTGGFLAALEMFDIDPAFETTVSALKKNDGLREAHYYFWDGRSKPLEFWLQDHFGIETPDVEPSETAPNQGDS